MIYNRQTLKVMFKQLESANQLVMDHAKVYLYQIDKNQEIINNNVDDDDSFDESLFWSDYLIGMQADIRDTIDKITVLMRAMRSVKEGLSTCLRDSKAYRKTHDMQLNDELEILRKENQRLREGMRK